MMLWATNDQSAVQQDKTLLAHHSAAADDSSTPCKKWLLAGAFGDCWPFRFLIVDDFRVSHVQSVYRFIDSCGLLLSRYTFSDAVGLDFT
jgi:hypothetical protein